MQMAITFFLAIYFKKGHMATLYKNKVLLLNSLGNSKTILVVPLKKVFSYNMISQYATFLKYYLYAIVCDLP